MAIIGDELGGELGTGKPELHNCYWCDGYFPDDEMYDTGWNHDPICDDCHYSEMEEQHRTGQYWVWVGDKRYPA